MKKQLLLQNSNAKSFAVVFLAALLWTAFTLASDSTAPERCPSSSQSCRSLLGTTISRPEDRFSNLLMALENVLRSAGGDPDKIISALTAEEIRGTLLHLQGLARLYGVLEIKEAKIIRTEIEDLEHAVGEVMRYQVLLEYTRASTQLTMKEKSHIQSIVETKKSALLDHMRKRDWLPDASDRLKKIRRHIDEMELKGLRKDKRLLVKALAESALEIRSALADREIRDHIMSDNYSDEDLERGPHTMRRRLRWINTMMQSARGVFAYRESNPNNQRLAALTTELGDSKYLRLAPSLDNPARLDKEPIYEIARLVTELGKLKDFKESQLDLANMLVETGVKKKLAKTRAQLILAETFPPVKAELRAQELYREYLEQDPLGNLYKNLQSEFDRLKLSDTEPKP